MVRSRRAWIASWKAELPTRPRGFGGEESGPFWFIGVVLGVVLSKWMLNEVCIYSRSLVALWSCQPRHG